MGSSNAKISLGTVNPSIKRESKRVLTRYNHCKHATMGRPHSYTIQCWSKYVHTHHLPKIFTIQGRMGRPARSRSLSYVLIFNCVCFKAQSTGKITASLSQLTSVRWALKARANSLKRSKSCD